MYVIPELSQKASFSLQPGKTPIRWDFRQIYILQVKSTYGPQKYTCYESPVADPVPGRAGSPALSSSSWEHPLEEFLFPLTAHRSAVT